MIKVLTLACLLGVAHQVAAGCDIPEYTENFIPRCAAGDVYIRWPDYSNFSGYYSCQGVSNPVRMSCPENLLFCYVYQQCVDCSQFLPAEPCDQLRSEYAPECVPMGQNASIPSTTTASSSGTTLPTPYYPGDSSTSVVSESTTLPPVTPPTVPTVPTPPSSSSLSSTPPSATTENGSTATTSDIPPPPSPSTINPLVPLPATPNPTPPSVPLTPPTGPSSSS